MNVCTCSPVSGLDPDCADHGSDARFAVPEPRSTPGPSTGTPEPSQAASEAHSGEVARLREALEQVRALHSPFRVYDECDCPDDAKDDGRHVEVEEVGLTCEVMYVACSECCLSPWGEVSEDCADKHRHTLDENDRCPTARTLASVDAPAPDEADERPDWTPPADVDAEIRQPR